MSPFSSSPWKLSQIVRTCFGLTVFLVIAISAGLSLMCWECNSEYDRRCADPFINRPFQKTDCSQKSLDHFPNMTAQMCRKITQKLKGGYRYIRACGYIEDERYECYRKAGTFDVQMEYCQCKTDGCNGASSVAVTHILIIAASMLLIFKGIIHKEY